MNKKEEITNPIVFVGDDSFSEQFDPAELSF